MSFVNAAVSPHGDRAWIVSDGLAASPGGIITNTTEPKVFWLAGFAVGVRGSVAAMAGAVEGFGRCSDTDQALEWFQPMLTACFSKRYRAAREESARREGLSPPVWGLPDPRDPLGCEVFIVGHSERNGRIVGVCGASYTEIAFQPKPFTRILAPSLEGTDLTWPGVRESHERPETLAHTLERAVHKQRDAVIEMLKNRPADSNMPHEFGGGTAMRYTITRGECVAEPLFRYPDAVGLQMIDGPPVKCGDEAPSAPEDAFAKAVRVMTARAAA
jgi:hypothetical protein